jgi:hypothetical protein
VRCRAWSPRRGGRVGRLRIFSSTWCASVRATWGANLGLLWTDLDFGPIMKVVHFMMPYKFHLSTMVIRPTD